MINIAPLAERRIQADRVANVYGVLANRRQQLAEAKAATTNPHLRAWKTEARALVDELEGRVAADGKRVAAFEVAVWSLEAAATHEAEARVEYERAKLARAECSLDRAEALRLRDDLEAADQALTVRRRAADDAARNVNSYLPTGDGVDEGGEPHVAKQIAAAVTTRRFKPEYADFAKVSRDVWNRWCEMPESDFAWIPVLAAREIKEAEADTRTEDSRREPVKLPIDEFVAELSRFKSEREARIRAKVAQAKAALEAAQGDVAALQGGAQ